MPSLFGNAQILSSQTQDQVQQHFLAAQQAQQQNRLDDAVNEYLAVLKLAPGLPEAWVNLGLVYYAQSKFDDSVRALSRAGKLRPGMRGVSLWLGIDEVRLNHPAQAVPLLREAVRQNPQEKQAESWLGTALWNAGQLDAALLQLRKAAALFSDDPDLLFALGEAYGKAAKQQSEQLLEDSAGTAISDRIYASTYAVDHDWTKAEGHLRRAIQRDPKSVDAHLDLAEVFLDQAQLPAALEQLQQAGTLSSRSATVLAKRGEVRILSGQLLEGLSNIELAIKVNESEALDAIGLPVEGRISAGEANADLVALCSAQEQKLEATQPSSVARDVALAGLYALSGDDAAAARAYKRLAPAPQKAKPNEGAFAQAIDAMHQHRYDTAEADLLRWLAIHPNDLSARYELVVVRRQVAIAQIARLVAVAPDSYHVHQLMGQLYVDREEDEKALAEYRDVEAADPNLPDVHFWLGHLYWKHGDADHAFAELTRQLELDPGHPEANGELGAVLIAKDRTAEAIPHLELAIRSKPDLWPAYQQLGQAYATQKNYAQAEEILKRDLAHDRDGGVHYQLAQVLRAEGKTDEAAKLFAQVRAIKTERSAAVSTDDHADHGAKQ
ncbi:tetratricopeptide repeat protein [Telmatobacter sp. DSM 110680]|uniref:Tetratricopeptide repeat protein n=1 Tax=Telmatobacter sp. DSM 110680 TaxID=3036704 RepID=A0AAU7DLR2_9BACT